MIKCTTTTQLLKIQLQFQLHLYCVKHNTRKKSVHMRTHTHTYLKTVTYTVQDTMFIKSTECMFAYLLYWVIGEMTDCFTAFRERKCCWSNQSFNLSSGSSYILFEYLCFNWRYAENQISQTYVVDKVIRCFRAFSDCSRYSEWMYSHKSVMWFSVKASFKGPSFKTLIKLSCSLYVISGSTASPAFTKRILIQSYLDLKS